MTREKLKSRNLLNGNENLHINSLLKEIWPNKERNNIIVDIKLRYKR